ncbi:MAG TPA: hypothetical protein DCY20_02220 [Firmicutes bacterium]|nr:hypothetical protein [Bacillota bacterium]
MNELKETILNNLKSIEREGMDKLIHYLEEQSDYFTAPASSKYHGNYTGGLAEHSHNVVMLLIEKNERYNLGLSNDSIYIAGYLHDMCKINLYTTAIRCRKNKADKWEGYRTYEFNDQLPLGHGEKSVIRLQQFIKLTVEEIMMIRWHMGPYVPVEDRHALHKAMEMFKSVTAMYTADLEASQMLEETVEPEVCSMDEYNQYKNSLK